MKKVTTLKIYSLLLLCLGMSSCSTSVSEEDGLYDPGYGPFDAKGNYLEAEADLPARQKRKPNMNGIATTPTQSEIAQAQRDEQELSLIHI